MNLAELLLLAVVQEVKVEFKNYGDDVLIACSRGNKTIEKIITYKTLNALRTPSVAFETAINEALKLL